MQTPIELLDYYEEIKQIGRLEATAEMQAQLKAKDEEIALLKNILSNEQQIKPNTPKIFFGTDDNTKNNITTWVDKHGEPAAWAVRDMYVQQNATKKYLNKYEIVSLDKAIANHPTAHIYLAYVDIPTAITVANQIAKKVDPQKIHFLEAAVEYRKSCASTGTYLAYERTTVSTCGANVTKRPSARILETSTAKQALETWTSFTTKLISDQRQGNPIPCDNCPTYKKGFYHKNPRLCKIAFLQSFSKDTCNFRCIYCWTTKSNNIWHKLRDLEGPTTKDILKQLSEIPDLANAPYFTVVFANGELLANRYCNEIFTIILNTKWKIDLISNSAIYNENFAKLMDAGKVRWLNTSLDAGTKETFAKIKGVDRFDKVLENLQKLPTHKTKLTLKYIFLDGINDNETDVDNFYAICKRLQANIQFSTDSSLQDNRVYTKQMKKLISNMAAWAKRDGINIDYDPNRVHPNDQAYINSLKIAKAEN